ncbi:DUF58 domain-containing protein [Bifidobacterium leontopitheci]|uniref:DUF58 domain-containing protein n=1 Tax=Bifidobacterium leontopitheci TaxID=2650774 RepID=A0A6I1GUQ1_9BIFI|nr:DUF58 domain-containing protein [Bifidobacterium leontopitheci]KAB7790181.1 hypothetical protein F7D09_1317 [Bifidobacterium leontopitheci]
MARILRRKPAGVAQRPASRQALRPVRIGRFGSSRLWRTVRRHVRRFFLTFVSPLGWTVIGIALASAIGFAATRWHELLAVAAVAAMMIVTAVAMSLGNTGFRATIEVSRRRVTVQDTVHVSVVVRNPSHTPTATARGDLPLGETHERFGIPMLTPGQSKQTDLEFTAISRAVLEIGPLSIRKGDPFGLIRHEKSLAERITVYIHPRVVHLNVINAGVARDLEGQPSGQIVDDDLDFYGLREYEPGDDVRNVHWLSSAKTGTLMIRQYEATRRTDTSMTLDVNPQDYLSQEEFELAVGVHASLGVQCLAQDRPLETHAGRSHATPKHAMAFLDECSAIEPQHDDNPNLVENTLRHTPDASFYFFTVGSLKKLDQIKRMVPALPKSATCLVLQTMPRANRELRFFSDFTLATLGSLDDLPAVMEALS